jgi:hypothetical protein
MSGVLESEDTQAFAAAKASREAFTSAQHLAANRQASHDAAELAEAEMESEFSQGNDSISAIEYATAQAEVSRTELLHNAAQAAEKAAQAGVISTDVTLSLIALPWVQSALKGVEVKASFYTSKLSPDKPVAYVIQRTPTEDLHGGSVAGKVEVRYYRPDLYRALDAGDIQAAAERAHCRVVVASGSSQEYGDGMQVDTVAVKIERGQSPIPFIKDDPTSRQASSHVAHGFGADLAAHCQAKTDGPVRATGDREYVGAAVTVKPIDGKVIGMEFDDAGVRTTSVQLELTYHREGVRVVNVDTHLRELCQEWEGSFVTDFGLVASATGRCGFSDPVGDTAIGVKVVFESAIR